VAILGRGEPIICCDVAFRRGGSNARRLSAQHSPYLPWVRLFGGLLLVLAGVWVVVAGPLYHPCGLTSSGRVLPLGIDRSSARRLM
jgi:hypothetical protein